MKKILVIDDDKLVRWSLEESLKDEGYCVKSCSTAEDAIKEVKNTGIDVAIIDLKKPFVIDEIKKLINTICRGGDG